MACYSDKSCKSSRMQKISNIYYNSSSFRLPRKIVLPDLSLNIHGGLCNPSIMVKLEDGFKTGVPLEAAGIL